MMRRLSEPELTREPARALSEGNDVSGEHEQRASLLAHVSRALAHELSSEQLHALRPRLEHAIACGLRGDP